MYDDEMDKSEVELDKNGFPAPPKWDKSEFMKFRQQKTKFSKIIEPHPENNPLLK